MTSSDPLLVALDLPLRAGDVAFTFAAGAADGASRGCGVVVPFGRRLIPGIVLGQGLPREELRPVLAVVEPAPLIPPAVVDFAAWTAREYLSSVGEALAAAVPWDLLWKGARVWCRATPAVDLPPKGKAAVEAMARGPVALARAGRLLAGVPEALPAIAQARLLAVALPHLDALGRPTYDVSTPKPRNRRARRGTSAALGASPTDESPAEARPAAGAVARLDGAVRDAMAGGPRAILLAGWDRTPAYLAAVRRARAAGWPALAAFASVEAASRFARSAHRAGLAPLLLHGEIPPAARLAAWHALTAAGDALVVGTRGVVFAPVRDPALVIVDDEDNSGHKEERAPRYMTAAVAAQRTRPSGVLIRGAATPTVEAYAAVQAGTLPLVALPSPRPRLVVVDLRRRPDPPPPVSRPVLDTVRRIGRRRGRVILLVERRGYAPGLQCGECGTVVECPRCGIAMAYQTRPRRLRCRVCGRIADAPHVCARCGAPRLMPLGAGTERVVAAVRRVTAQVWRFDSDVAKPGLDPAVLLSPFRERGGVLVATTMILPHLESLHPDAVAVVGADRLLHRPEYRAAERALALLRTVGSAARAPVLVETADPMHPSIRAALAPSLQPFYLEELEVRRALGYPPFRSLAVLTVTGNTAAALDAVAARLAAAAASGVEVLGPTPRLQPEAHGRTVRSEFVIKSDSRAALRPLILPLLLGEGIPRGVSVAVDVDPHDL